ncbi:Gem-associated protein 8 [Anthophora quadrimaculata]
MEFVAIKRGKSRRKRGHLKKRRREQIKIEVKSAKRREFVSERGNILFAKEKFLGNTMEAHSFWENYTVAQEWQKRHCVTWWRTRCIALEHENQRLREVLRSLVCQNAEGSSLNVQNDKSYEYQDVEEEQDETASSEETENFEFHVDEDMMSFLEQSMRHKIELKKKRESELVVEKEKEDDEDLNIQGGATWMHARNSNAKLLYGEASPTILAMETALQTTVDRHKDKAKPQYWPIIPLKP